MHWPTLTGRRHPRQAQLSRYLDGELRGDERERLEDHLLRCERCRRLLASLASSLRALASLPQPEAPGLAEGIIAEIRAADARSPALGAASAASHSGALPHVRPSLRLAAPRSLLRAARPRLTVPLALLVGTILTLINQGGMLFAGRIDLRMCATCGLNFVVPFLALSLALIAAERLGGHRREG
jgi:putative zinc finger protein